MPNTRTIYRRQRKRPARSLDGVDPVARTYERGREAPFSPRTPEIADRNSPAVVEVKRRAEAGNVSKSGGAQEDQDKADSGGAAGRRKAPRSVH